MKYHEMIKNDVFREFECGLSIEQTAELCFKSIRTVKGWDKGNDIPKECKYILSPRDDWHGFKMYFNELELPKGQLVTVQEYYRELLCYRSNQN